MMMNILTAHKIFHRWAREGARASLEGEGHLVLKLTCKVTQLNIQTEQCKTERYFRGEHRDL